MEKTQLKAGKTELSGIWLSITKVMGICILLFATLGMLRILLSADIGLDGTIQRAIPYSALIMSGVGVLLLRHWGRVMVIALSFTGLILKLLEISEGPNRKDLAQALVFVILIFFFTRKRVEEQFCR